MRHNPITLAWILLLALPGMGLAAESADPDLVALRAQLQALSERLDELEAVNAELRQSQATLQQASRETTSAVAAVSERTAAMSEQFDQQAERKSWADSIRIAGDFRYRYETIDPEGGDERRRNRVRARAAIIAKVKPDLEVGLGMASGGNDPVSTNQTLGGGGSTKDLGLDLAYFDYSGLANTHIVGGKFKQMQYKPGKHSLLWDSDWRPEGFGVAWDNGRYFANAMGNWVESDSAKTTEFAYTLQAGLKWRSEGGLKLTAGIGYYRFDTAGKGSFFGDDDDFFGNSFDPATNTYLFDYHEIELFADLGFELAGRPAMVFADYVQNQDADEFDTGYALGFKYGSAKAKGTWEFGYAYQDLEADAALGLLVDSDFGGGGTDVSCHVLQGGYAIAPGWNANFTYFINKAGANAGAERDYDRLQLDMSFKY